MRTVHIGVSSLGEQMARAKAAFKGKPQGEHISFASFDLMHRMLTPNRWDILRAMMGRGEVGVRELARLIGRDVKAVHTDITALVKAGLIDRSEGGGVVFTYDAIHVEFVVKAAA